MTSRQHNYLRRQAIQITSQLPDNTADALAVLDFARDLVLQFLDQPKTGASDNIGVSANIAVFSRKGD